MKKRILLTLGASLIAAASFAQAPITLKKGLGVVPQKSFNANKQITDSYLFDYMSAEEDLGSEIVAWFAADLQDRRDTTSIFGNSRGYYSIVAKYADLVVLKVIDANNIEVLYGDYDNVQEVKLDSVNVFMGFNKTTGGSVKDTLLVTIHNVDANNHPILTGTPIASQIIELTAPFPSAGPGYGEYRNIDFGGLLIPNKKFAVRYEYKGSADDTLYIGYGYASDGTPCVINGTTQSYNAPIAPNYYPVSYYTSPYGVDTLTGSSGDSIIHNQTSVLVPRDPASQAPGAYIWYNLCNGVSPSIDGVQYANNPATNSFQYLMSDAYVTLKHNISVQDMEAKSVIVNNFPNPAVENTTIEYTVPAEGNVTLTVTDLTGKQLVNQNLGKVAGGKNSYVLNTTEFNAGVYIYTVNYNGTQVTRKFVVSK